MRDLHSPTTAAPSPLDTFTTCDTLDGYVCDLSQGFFVHGHDIMRAMAAGGSFSQFIFLALVGHMPSHAQRVRFERALHLAGQLDICDAPCHAARLARVQRAAPSDVLSVGCIALSQRARAILEHTTPLRAWLDDMTQPLSPDRQRCVSPPGFDPQAVLRGFRDATLAALRSQEPDLHECLIALLHAAGLRLPWQLTSALVMGAIPIIMAEAFFAPDRLKDYPVNLPEYRYIGGPDPTSAPRLASP